ncbi:MAG TPA: NADH-quinone oxidoreductase subunit NuoN [Alphaproteobacteria bacterium]|nr:NADH-quinone oxidoreductase subunit NuoN [Alphaproteobacteria bacterium]
MSTWIPEQAVAALPELFLAVSIMALLLIGVFRGDSYTRTISWFAVAVTAVAVFVVAGTAAGPGVGFGNMFLADAFARYGKVLVLIGTGLALVLSISYIEREDIARFEYPILFLFACLGMMMMISANDLIALYVGLELQSLALYVAAAFRRDSVRSPEAGLKYFVLGALSSGMLLYGASLVYGFAGTTGFEGIAKAVSGGHASLGVIVGMVFISAGLAFKVSAVPFHMWTPDVYEGAPTSVTAFFAIAPKAAAMVLFVRVLAGPFAPIASQWQQVVVLIAILSMALGAFAAINQRNIKRLMAYSSIGNVGYMLVGLAAGTEAGVRGVLIYLAIYLAMTAGTFACILCMRVHGRAVNEIDDLAGLARTRPLIALALGVFMFSLAGIPPLAGFFGKLYVFLAAVEAGLYGLAVIGVLATVVAAFYYVRIVKIMYFDEPVESFDRLPGREVGVVLAGTGVFTALFFVLPGPVVGAAAAAAKSLFAG